MGIPFPSEQPRVQHSGMEALGAVVELGLVLLREQGWAGLAAWAAQDQSLEVQGQQVLTHQRGLGSLES